MIVLLDTSTPTCHLTLVDGDERFDDDWLAGRTLARDLLGYLEAQLAKHGKTMADITAIGAFAGPGSFTGLRIGLTVLNTIADTSALPIVGVTGENWRETALARLRAGDSDVIVMPQYGREAHITAPRK